MNQPPREDKENLNFRAGDDSGVKYTDETGWRAMRYYREPTSPKIIQWVLKYSGGLVKNGKQAQYVLLGFVTIAFVVSLFLFFGGGSNSSSNNKPPIYQEDLTPTIRASLPKEILNTIPSR